MSIPAFCGTPTRASFLIFRSWAVRDSFPPVRRIFSVVQDPASPRPMRMTFDGIA